MTDTNLIIAISVVAVSFMIGISIVNLRLHNSKAERIFLHAAEVEQSFLRISSLVDDLATQQVALTHFTDEAVSVANQEKPNHHKVANLLGLTAKLISTETPVRVRILLHESGRLVPYVDYVPEGVSPFRGSTFDVGEGAVGLAFQSSSPVLIDSIQGSELFSQSHSSVGVYESVLCVPIPSVGPPSGVLNLDAPAQGFFLEEHVVTLRTISNIIYLVLNPSKDFARIMS